ncbi:hypothetical protein OJ633_002929 [Listeria monocytogenes]|nr:hypothetical protein [Listeria monocytogenes]EKA2555492.1 hypothetical protein [Listeria monocytogenes]EKA2558650.1 hypothetical protein [Listeria monocytogenes]EKA2561773.1 hypothetical protein [Listeria monocytogenes]EKA2564941.1 hypothetical protein [Listeria monocytogenes]
MLTYRDLPDYAYGYRKQEKKTVIIMKDTGEVVPCKAENIPPKVLNKEMGISPGIMAIMMMGQEKGFQHVKEHMDEMRLLAEAIDEKEGKT